MIKISNAKSIKEINELRDKGIYNDRFSVLEAMGKVGVGVDHGEVEEKLQEIEMNNAMAAVSVYKMVEDAKQEVLEEQAKAIVDVYVSIGGM